MPEWTKDTQTGKTFNSNGSAWLILSVTTETNTRFAWENVVAKWTGFGPAPMWPNDARTFYLNRRFLNGVRVS